MTGERPGAAAGPASSEPPYAAPAHRPASHHNGAGPRPRLPRHAPGPPPDGAPPHPDAELLDGIATGALRWLAAQLASFRLPADVATDADPNMTLKPLGELAELTQVIQALHPLPAVRDTAAELLAFAWKETRDGELFAELVRGEPLATYPVELYGVFARAGLRNPGAEELIGATTALRRWRVAREDHTRTLGVLNAERRIGLPQHTGFDAVLARTGLGLTPEPWALDLRSAYGVTHDVFHVTDWGRTPDRLPGPLADYLRLWLPAWTRTWAEERLWDLVGEFLAVAACLPGAPYDRATWRLLAAARTARGALPESGDPPQDDAGAGGAGGDGEEFLACYHSTLVAAFAATLARARPPGSSRRAAGHARPDREDAGHAPDGVRPEPAPAPADAHAPAPDAAHRAPGRAGLKPESEATP